MPPPRALLLTSALLLLPLAAPAAATESGSCREREELIPDIFGFSSGSDVAAFRSVGLGIEYGGAFESRAGRFAGNEVKAQVSAGLLPCLEVGPSLFGGRELFQSFDAFGDELAESFGAGLEMKLKLLGRAQYGVGLTLVAEPTYARVRERVRGLDDTGVPATAHARFDEWGLASKILLDAVLVPDRVFLAVNLAHEAAWPDVTPAADTSTLIASAAVSVRFGEAFFAGVEARYLRAYDGAWLDRARGDAWFLGPTFFWAISESLGLSGTWSTQVSGDAKPDPVTGDPSPGRLNLVDFNHHEAKLKLGISF